MLIIFGLPLPMLIGGFFGFRAGNRDPHNAKAFWIGAAWAFAWTVLWVFLWQALWIFALFGSELWNSVTAGLMWTGIAGLFWLPVMMITYVTRAAAVRRRV